MSLRPPASQSAGWRNPGRTETSLSKAKPSKPAQAKSGHKKPNEVGAEVVVELSDTQLQAVAGGRAQKPYTGETEKN